MLPELIGTDAEGNGNALPESAEPRSIHAPHMLIIDDKSAAELPSVPLNTTERAACALAARARLRPLPRPPRLAQRRAERRGPRR